MRGSLIVVSAMAAILSGAGLAPSAAAEDSEKCFGIAAANQNDCQTASNACAGQVAEAERGDAYISVPTGTCQKISGGSLEPKQS